jgi:hypothetical protein
MTAATKNVIENTSPDHIFTVSGLAPISRRYRGKNGITIV